MNSKYTGETVVLAFSGGLDTSYCVLALREQGFAVHTVLVDSGGIGDGQKAWIAERALQLGAAEHHTLDGSQAVWDEFVVPLVYSHARMRNQYPLLCSDRYVIVRLCLALCEELGTRHFAHGCTGMGNDQLRFDQTVDSLGEYTIHAPIRDLQSRTDKVREHECTVLQQHGIAIPDSVSRYSINENLLGVTISGSEIDRFQPPADDTWTLCRPPDEWPAQPLTADIEFEQGRAVALDGRRLAGPALLAELNQAYGAYGVGRHIYTGDVSIGLKGRIVFECPGIDVLLNAHQALEDAVNTRWQNQFRNIVAERWAELVYTGFFYEPHKRDLEAYLLSSQQAVSGTVSMQAHAGQALPVAVRSPYILQQDGAVYAQHCDWSPEQAVGFIKLLGQSSTLAARVRGQQR